MAGLFQDFIPEGEDAGAVGDGFKDFVAPLEPKTQDSTPLVPEVDIEEEEVEVKKK